MCTVFFSFLCLFGITLGLNAYSTPTTVEIAPGVDMPLLNLGGINADGPFDVSNYSQWLALGGRGLDSAYTYAPGVQKKLGEAIATSGLPRSEVFVTTKFPCCPSTQNGTASWTATCASGQLPSTPDTMAMDLNQLGLDYVDLMLMHWPCDRWEDTVNAYRALEVFARQKKARAIGVSNFNSSLIKALLEVADIPPALNQVGFSIGGHSEAVLGRDLETLRTCQKANITLSAYSPLGKLSHHDVLHDPVVSRVAGAHNRSTAQVALRWVVQQGVVAVTATNNPIHEKTDLAIFDFRLSNAEMDALTAVGPAADSAEVQI